MGYASYKESVDERRAGQPMAAVRGAMPNAPASPQAPDADLRVRTANVRAREESVTRQLTLLRELSERLGLRLETDGGVRARQIDVLERCRAVLAERETLATQLRASKETNERMERVVVVLKRQIGDREAEHRRSVDEVKSLERELSERKREVRSPTAAKVRLEAIESQLDDCRSACDRLRAERDRLGDALRTADRRLVSKNR